MRITCRALSAVAVLCLTGLAKPILAEDLSALSLEELMAMEVVATPQFAGRSTDLPASVTILTANDFRVYGWRTLADALRSLRGFNVTNDRTYSYAGVRGLSLPGDYKPRLSLMIDGISASENIYNSILIGGEFPLDVDLIDRIEIVRGPSSSVVGGDALGGVINIITRSGGALRGVETAVSAGGNDAYSARASVGGVGSNDLEYLISASGYDARGDNLSFPEMAPLGYGTTTDNDDERRRQLFAKFGYEGWHATLIHGKREKAVPTGSYGTIFNDPAHQETDTETLAEIGHKAWLDTSTTLSTRVFTGLYDYDGIFPYSNDDPSYPSTYHNRDRSRGRWWGTETRLQSHLSEYHQVMAGAEFVDNYRQDQYNDDIGYGCVGYGSEPCLNNRHSSNKWSIYGQDEILLTAQTRVTLGLRLDRTVDHDQRWSPRLGLVQHTDHLGTFKLLYATAYSEPNVFQRYYNLPGVTTANPNLHDERLQSFDGIWEYAFDARTQLAVVFYRYQVENIIAPSAIDGAYQNLPSISGRGVAVELTRNWHDGTALRTSYTGQYPELSGERPANAPQHLLKFNLTTPIANSALNAGFEMQATSRRRTEMNTTLPGYSIANLNLLYAPKQQPWEIALTLYNLFDHIYADPIAADIYMDPRVVRDSIEQDGRKWRLKLTYRF